MVNEYIINKDKVLIVDGDQNLIKVDNYSNIEENFTLNNKLEILEGKEAFARGKLRRLKDTLNNRKLCKSIALIFSIISLVSITLIEIIANCAFTTILMDFLMTFLSFGTLNVLFRIFLNKFYPNPQKYQREEDTLNNEISYLGQEIAKVKLQILDLKQSKSNMSCETVSKSLVKYNEEQELLINAKLQLIREYHKRKGEYIDSFNKGTLKKLVNDPDEEILIRELVLKDIKNNKN